MPAPPPGTQLVPIDALDGAEQDLLYSQRIVCGWKIKKVPFMLQQMREGKRILLWIGIPADADEYVSTDGTKRATHEEANANPELYVKMSLLKKRAISELKSPMLNQTQAPGDLYRQDTASDLLPVGHISIDVGDYDANPSDQLGSLDGSTMLLTTLFVLPCYRHLGLGSWAMREAERLIRYRVVIPPTPGIQCHTLTLSTLSGKHFFEDSPEGKGLMEASGINPEKGDITYHGPWYQKLGYEKFGGQPKWPYNTMSGLPDSDAVGDALWWAEFWRKELR